MYLDYIYNIGACIGFLEQAIFHNYPVKGKESEFILSNLKDLRYFCKQLDIDKSTISEINKTIKDLDKKYKVEQNLKKKDAEELNEEVIGWRSLLLKDFSERCVEEVYTEGMLNWKLLFEGAEDYFEPKYWKKLPKICKSDLNDAARCILLKIPTPAAMITLRTIEKTIRIYYEYKTGNKADRRLKVIIDQLSKRSDVNTSLINHLDYMRDSKRNIAEHPEKIFNQRESEKIFLTSVDTIEEIYADMKK